MRIYNWKIIAAGAMFAGVKVVGYLEYEAALLGWILTSLFIVTNELDNLHSKLENKDSTNGDSSE